MRVGSLGCDRRHLRKVPGRPRGLWGKEGDAAVPPGGGGGLGMGVGGGTANSSTKSGGGDEDAREEGGGFLLVIVFLQPSILKSALGTKMNYWVEKEYVVL